MELQDKVALVTGAGVVWDKQLPNNWLNLACVLSYTITTQKKAQKKPVQGLPGRESRHLILQADLKEVS
ncbi:MAG: hypothetical protein Ct9H300mP21_07070 [Pseudomonadota bacterium]|nr:MAG: hypothetical protein Ct9H300mP21_07070 [Pseudomonadota bacterium]